MPAHLRLPEPPGAAEATIRVAFSGGCDSTALLHLLKQRWPDRVAAVHVHHGLQAVADEWVEHCGAICAEIGVRLAVRRVEVKRGGQGTESAARTARYAALASCMAPGDIVATAHHRDDQAETVLFRALRGTGIDGLAAMRSSERFASGLLWRPLLDIPRGALRDYARAQGLRWIEDPHNADPAYDRAFIRQSVLPLLDSRFPAAAGNLSRLASHAQGNAQMLDDLAGHDLSVVGLDDGALSIEGLMSLSSPRRRNLLRRCWRELALPPPSEHWHHLLESQVLDAAADRTPLLVHGEGEVRRYRDGLYLMRRLAPEPGAVTLGWHGHGELVLPAGCGRLRNLRQPAGTPELAVSFAQGGERLQPAGGAHSRTLKNLWQEAGVPPWVRTRMPLVSLGGELIAVADCWRAQRAVDLGLDLAWQTGLPGWSPRIAH